MSESNLSYVAATPLPTSTWGAGDAPQASQWVGSIAGFKMPDGRTVQMISDGVRWRPIGPFITLQPNASVTGSTTETTLASVTIPANLLGSDGTIRIYALYSFLGTTGTKTIRCKLNGATFAASAPAATALSASIFKHLSNLTTGTQVAYAATAISDGASIAAPIVSIFTNTTADSVLTIHGQLGSSTDTISLAKVIVEIV